MGKEADESTPIESIHDIPLPIKARDVLSKSELNYRALFENASDGILYVSPGFKIVKVNQAFARMHGYSIAEIQQMNLQELETPEASQFTSKREAQLIADGNLKFEVEHFHKDGHIISLEVSSSLLSIEGEQIYLSFHREITERKQLEATLKKNEDRYHMLFNSMTEGFALHELIFDENGGPCDYRFLDINRAFEQLTGMKREDFIGKGQREVLPDEDPFWFKTYCKVALSGEAITLEHYSPPLQRHYEVYAYCPAKNQFAVIFSDITERKRAEAALRESEEKFRFMAENSSDIIWHLDSDYRFTYISPADERLRGFSRDEVLGTTIWSMLKPEGVEHVREKNALRLADEAKGIKTDTIRYQLEQVCKNGSWVWTEETVTAHHDKSGLLVGYHGVTRDISERKRTEETLRETNAYLENLINYANAPIIVWDPQFRITRFNHAFEFLTGRSETDVLLQSLEILFPPALAKASMELIRKTLTGERWETVEIQIMNRDESVRTVLWNSATLFLSDGQTPLATIAQGQDITERKQAEQALRESETRLRSLFDDSPISLWEEDFSAVKRRLDDLRAEGVVDFDVYLCQHPEVVSECIALVRVLDVNKATLTLFGATSKENMVKNLATSLPEAGNESFRTELVWIASGATHFEMEMIAQTVNGRMITVNLNWAVVHGYEDDLSKVIVSIENISERKRSEVEITRTLSILESTMESTADGILVADGKGGIVRFNLRFRDMWNIPEPIIAAKDDEAAISFVIGQLTEPEFFLKTVRSLYDASEQISFDVLELKDGRVIERYSQPQRIGDLVVGRVWSFRDVTERKRAENALHAAHAELEQRVIERTAELQAANLELEKSARMKDEFLASMSHELRTPLTGILGLSDVMQMPHVGPLNEKQRSYLTNIHSSGERLLEIINDMLDFSMIESGKVNLSLNPCSLKEICQSSLQLTESQASAKGLQSNLSITPENILLNADARRLQKILVNLLGNAVKFTPKNGSFGIEARGDRTAGQVKITVWDNGIGIQEQDLPRLFQLFIQLDARLGRQYEGTGLGLAMVRRLTELHGGSVSVQSVPGQGSRFTVTLPWQPG